MVRRDPSRAARAPGPPRATAESGRLPHTIEPMTACAGAEPFDSPAHIFEVLWDGVRAIAFVEGGRLRLQDGFGRDVTHRYPELGAIAAQVNDDGVAVDGNIVALDADGVPDISRLLRRASVDDAAEAARRAAEAPVTVQAFDILYRNGEPLMSFSLRRRKELLRLALRPKGAVALPDYVARDGIAFFEAARQHNLEGIIAKEWDSRYVAGQRSRAWLKIKVYQKDEFVVGGFTYGGQMLGLRPGRQRRPFASLLLGLYGDDARLRYAGEVTGGFDEMPEEDAALLDGVADRECPFREEPALGRLVFWCRPELAATVRFAGWSPEGRLRFPLFESLRPDVPAESCRPDGPVGLDWARE